MHVMAIVTNGLTKVLQLLQLLYTVYTVYTVLMFAFVTLLRAHKTLRFPQVKNPASIHNTSTYATMATDPKKYSLNRMYPPIKIA